MNHDYNFVHINDVTSSDICTENLVIINKIDETGAVYQPINCNKHRFVQFMSKHKNMKLVRKHDGLFRFDRINQREI